MKRALPFLIIAAVFGLALVTAWSLKRSAAEAPTPRYETPAVSPNASPNASAPATTPAVADAGADPPHAHGPVNAPVVIEEFGDFQCPPCAMLHPVLKTMEKEFGSGVRIIFREFPLVPTHQHALAAARAAEAAGLQGKFWQMHELIYTNQNSWKDAFDVRPIFEEYATRIGLNLDRYRQDLTSETVQYRIFLDGKRARSLGVKGTPTVFMNGREVPFESLTTEKLRLLIIAEIAAVNKRGQ
jgi:protein-disulfide isomerase